MWFRGMPLAGTSQISQSVQVSQFKSVRRSYLTSHGKQIERSLEDGQDPNLRRSVYQPLILLLREHWSYPNRRTEYSVANREQPSREHAYAYRYPLDVLFFFSLENRSCPRWAPLVVAYGPNRSKDSLGYKVSESTRRGKQVLLTKRSCVGLLE
jgi:hypothetical protein